MATELERLVVSMEAQTAKFTKALERVEAKTSGSMKKIEARVKKTQMSIDATLGGAFAKTLGALGVGLGAQQVIQYADAWTKAQNSLKVAGLSGETLKSTLDAIYGAAQRQGAPLEALTTLYGRLAQSQKELGASNGELIQFTEDVATALRVAGTTPEQAQGALLQLGQALASARVQAEEFNSVNEGARPVLQAVANGIEEAGGSVAKLKQLVNDGEISNVAFFKGFQAGVQTLRDQAATAEPTISQAFTRIQNALMKLIGDIDSINGFSRSFVAELSYMADGLRDLEPAIQFVIDALKMLKDLQDYVNKNGLNLGTKINDLFAQDPQSKLAEGLKSYSYSDTVAKSNQYNAALGGSGGIGSDPDRNLAKPVRAADYPVVGSKSKGGGGAGSSDYARETQQIRDRTAALELEAQTMGKSTFEVEKAKVAQELLNAAKADGKAITPELTAQINAEAEAYARAAEKVEAAKESYQLMQEVQDGLASAFSGAVSAAAKGEDAIESLKNSLLSLQGQLLDMIAKQLFSQLFPGFSAGGTVGTTSGAGYVKAATGGRIVGAGSGTSDSIPAMLSNGEFVVRAAMAKRFGPLLEALNSGSLRVPRAATGGSVGMPARGGGLGGGLQVNVINNAGADVQARETTVGGRRQLEILLEGAMNKSITGGRTDRSFKGRFGLGPSVVRRG